jgi:hypothetical protein
MEALISLLAGVVLGGVVSWAISRHYYRQAIADSSDAAIAQRLDDCSEGDKTFLVALFQTGRPIPRYAIINVEFETLNRRKGSWGSNTSTMVGSVNSRARHSLQVHGGSNTDEDRQTISLTERGKENAEYLVRREYRTASFTSIEDTDSYRLAIFEREHKREPRKGTVGGSGIVSSYTTEF